MCKKTKSTKNSVSNFVSFYFVFLSAVVLLSMSGIAKAKEPVSSQIHITVGRAGADIGGMTSLAIQAGIDYVAGAGGGVVELTEGEFLIQDAVYLRSGVVLRGQGEKTILKKNPVIRTKLAIGADIHEKSITVENPDGFEVGMGVSIGSNTSANMDYVSVRTITWKSGNVLGFFKHFETTLRMDKEPIVQTTFPVIYCLEIENFGIENLVIDGNIAGNQPMMVDSWLTGCVYVTQSRKGRIVNCRVHHAVGEGLSWNRADDIEVDNCTIHNNARIGLHVGTGSLRTVIKNCRIYSNGEDKDTGEPEGIFLCYSAQHGLYENNQIYDNRGSGISIGHKDGDNLFVNNVIRGNGNSGVLYRVDTYRAYNNVFRNCLIEDNKPYGFHIKGDAHNTTLTECTIRDTRPKGKKTQLIGVYVEKTKDVNLVNCSIENNAEQNIKRVDN